MIDSFDKGYDIGFHWFLNPSVVCSIIVVVILIFCDPPLERFPWRIVVVLCKHSSTFWMWCPN
jgi:hypothetical protein